MTRWTADEATAIAAAVDRAPSAHNTRPWALELGDRTASVVERTEIALPHHDPTGRDRRISCGAALANAHAAVRGLGHRADWTWLPDPRRPEVVGRVEGAGLRPPTPSEAARYLAIPARRSHRAAFAPDPVDPGLLHALTRAAGVPGTAIHVVGNAPALARALSYSASVFRHDRAYLRELAAWAVLVDDDAHQPFPVLVDEHTPIPDAHVLTARLAAETQLIVTTDGDTRHDHVAAGMALERVWLDAVAAGLAASVTTQPLHLAEVRVALAADLAVGGYPQAVLRVGHPVEVPPATGDCREHPGRTSSTGRRGVTGRVGAAMGA